MIRLEIRRHYQCGVDDVNMSGTLTLGNRSRLEFGYYTRLKNNVERSFMGTLCPSSSV